MEDKIICWPSLKIAKQLVMYNSILNCQQRIPEELIRCLNIDIVAALDFSFASSSFCCKKPTTRSENPCAKMVREV